MSKPASKFTQDTWSFIPSLGNINAQTSGKIIATVAGSSDFFENYNGYGENLANARLIKHAPDMYYLLRALQDMLLIEFENRNPGDMPLSYYKISELLDKIEGEN